MLLRVERSSSTSRACVKLALRGIWLARLFKRARPWMDDLACLGGASTKDMLLFLKQTKQFVVLLYSVEAMRDHGAVFYHYDESGNIHVDDFIVDVRVDPVEAVWYEHTLLAELMKTAVYEQVCAVYLGSASGVSMDVATMAGFVERWWIRKQEIDFHLDGDEYDKLAIRCGPKIGNAVAGDSQKIHVDVLSLAKCAPPGMVREACCAAVADVLVTHPRGRVVFCSLMMMLHGAVINGGLMSDIISTRTQRLMCAPRTARAFLELYAFQLSRSYLLSSSHTEYATRVMVELVKHVSDVVAALVEELRGDLASWCVRLPRDAKLIETCMWLCYVGSCVGCMRQATRFHCAACTWMRYCSEECQRTHWAAHHCHACSFTCDDADAIPSLVETTPSRGDVRPLDAAHH